VVDIDVNNQNIISANESLELFTVIYFIVFILNNFHFQYWVLRYIKILCGMDGKIFRVEKPIAAFGFSDFTCYDKINYPAASRLSDNSFYSFFIVACFLNYV